MAREVMYTVICYVAAVIAMCVLMDEWRDTAYAVVCLTVAFTVACLLMNEWRMK